MSLRGFLQSEDTEFAFRIVLGGAIPLLLCTFLGYEQQGLLIMLGSSFISGIDLPAELPRKLKLMTFSLIATPLIFSLISFSSSYPPVMYILLFVFIFILSFLAPFSFHFGKVAFMSNLAIMLSLGFAANINGWQEILTAAGYLFLGGLWYMGFASMMHFIQRPAQANRRLSQTIKLTAEYFALREKIFQPNPDIPALQLELSKKQAEIAASHELVRGMLMRDYGYKISPKRKMGKILHLFASVVDLFEEAIVSSGKLLEVGQNEQDSTFRPVLMEINGLFTTSLYTIYDFIQSTQPFLDIEHVQQGLENQTHFLKSKLNQWRSSIPDDEQSLPEYNRYKSIQLYLDQQVHTLNQMFNYLRNTENMIMEGVNTHSIRKFETHDRLDIDRLSSHFTLQSGYFRYALRVAITAMTAYFIAMILGFQNPNWALFTALVILKPGYKVSQKRLWFRVLGTGVGVIIAYLIFITLSPTQPLNILFFLLAFFGGFAFLNKNYAIASIFFTMYILFLYRFLDRAFLPSALFRFLDTGLAAVLCIFSIRLLFPFWENRSIKYFLWDSLQANFQFFKSIFQALQRSNINITDYKVYRKEAQLKMGNLMSTYQRILTEPPSKRGNVKTYAHWVLISSSILTVCSNFSLFFQRHPNYVLERNYILEYFEYIIQYWDSILSMAQSEVPKARFSSEEISAFSKEMTQDINRLQKQTARLAGGYTEIYIHQIQELSFIEELLNLLQLLQHMEDIVMASNQIVQHSVEIKYS